jgi:hypothetical protein
MAIIIPPADRSEIDISSLLRWHTAEPIVVDLGSSSASTRLRAYSHRLRRIHTGFATLAAIGVAPKRLAILNPSHGIEAIVAGHVLPSIETIILAHSDRTALQRAAANVARNFRRPIHIVSVSGVTAIAAARSSGPIDLLYADLLSVQPMVAASLNGPRASLRNTRRVTDEWFDRCQLAVAHQLLAEMPALLATDGIAIVAIAGHAGFKALDRLAASAGLQFEALASGLMRQNDGAVMLPVYADAEAPGLTFEFYDFQATRLRLREAGDRIGIAFDELLLPWRVTAIEALTAFRAGCAIGHTYHLLRATPC